MIPQRHIHANRRRILISVDISIGIPLVLCIDGRELGHAKDMARPQFDVRIRNIAGLHSDDRGPRLRRWLLPKLSQQTLVKLGHQRNRKS